MIRCCKACVLAGVTFLWRCRTQSCCNQTPAATGVRAQVRTPDADHTANHATYARTHIATIYAYLDHKVQQAATCTAMGVIRSSRALEPRLCQPHASRSHTAVSYFQRAADAHHPGVRTGRPPSLVASGSRYSASEGLRGVAG